MLRTCKTGNTSIQLSLFENIEIFSVSFVYVGEKNEQKQEQVKTGKTRTRNSSLLPDCRGEMT